MLHEAIQQDHEASQPTITTIDGPVLGGGLELALACGIHWQMAVQDVDKIALPECRIGIIPGTGST